MRRTEEQIERIANNVARIYEARQKEGDEGALRVLKEIAEEKARSSTRSIREAKKKT